MSEDFKWLIGTAVTLIVFFSGALIAWFRSLNKRLDQVLAVLAQDKKV